MRMPFLILLIALVSCREGLVDPSDLRKEQDLIGNWYLDEEWPENLTTIRMKFSSNRVVRIDNSRIGSPQSYRFWVDLDVLYFVGPLDADTVSEFSYVILELTDQELTLEYTGSQGLVQRRFNRQ